MDPKLLEYLMKKQEQESQAQYGDSMVKAGGQLGAALAGAATPDMSVVDDAAKQRASGNQMLNDYLKTKATSNNVSKVIPFIKPDGSVGYSKVMQGGDVVDIEGKSAPATYIKANEEGPDGGVTTTFYNKSNPADKKTGGHVPKNTTYKDAVTGDVNVVDVNKKGLGARTLPKGKLPENIEFGDATAPQQAAFKDIENDYAKELKPIQDTLNSVDSGLKLLASAEKDPALIGVTATEVATSIQKGVLSDQDIGRTSGVPMDVWSKGEDYIKKYLFALPPANQLATLKRILMAQAAKANKDKEALDITYGARAKKYNLKGDSIIQPLPSSGNTTQGSGLSPDQRQKRIQELKAKMGK